MATNLLEQYSPPFDLTSDMLFVAALCRTGPLQQSFPEVPFLSVGGRTPLVIWLSRVRQIGYYDEHNQLATLGGPRQVLYNELNVVALLHRRAFFVPGIYATGELTIRIGLRYGMPKEATRMDFARQGQTLCSTVVNGGQKSYVWARLLGTGAALARPIAWLWPRRIWPTCFPTDDEVRPLITATPRVQPALVRRGRLALDEPWLPAAVSLLPLGVYLPGQRMELPPP
ncbi:MAG: hypothetical protein M3220_07885 [Chloroflexota bacterium]|nr:hypothetical protein [Chloroflexota bacterium]